MARAWIKHGLRNRLSFYSKFEIILMSPLLNSQLQDIGVYRTGYLGLWSEREGERGYKITLHLHGWEGLCPLESLMKMEFLFGLQVTVVSGWWFPKADDLSTECGSEACGLGLVTRTWLLDQSFSIIWDALRNAESQDQTLNLNLRLKKHPGGLYAHYIRGTPSPSFIS